MTEELKVLDDEIKLIKNDFDGLLTRNTRLTFPTSFIFNTSLSTRIIDVTPRYNITPLAGATSNGLITSYVRFSGHDHCISRSREAIKDKFEKIKLNNNSYDNYKIAVRARFINSIHNDSLFISSIPELARDAAKRLLPESIINNLEVYKKLVLRYVKYNFFDTYKFDIFFGINFFNSASNTQVLNKEEILPIFSGETDISSFKKLPTRVGKSFYIHNHYLISGEENEKLIHIAPCTTIDNFYVHYARNLYGLPVDTEKVVYLVDEELFKDDYSYKSIKKYFDDVFLPELLKYKTSIVKVPASYITAIHKSEDIDFSGNIMEIKKMKEDVCRIIRSNF